jgi:hypothetical protein
MTSGWVCAQEWILAFERSAFDARSIHIIEDAGFIVGGDNVLIKLDPHGQVTWQFDYRSVDSLLDIYDLQPTSDGGYVVAADTKYKYPDTVVCKLDGTGQVEWARLYDAWDWFHPASVRQTADDGFVLAGYIRWEHPGPEYWERKYDLLALKLTGTGQVEWAWKLGRSEHDEAFWVEPTPEGGCVISGRTGYRYEKRRDMWVVKLTSFGTVEWQRLYGGADREEAACIRSVEDGGYILAGWESSYPGPDGALILRLSPEGEIQWQRSIKRKGRPLHAAGVTQTPQGDFVVTGGGWEESTDLWAFKISSRGSLEWQRIFVHERAAAAYSITGSGDGGTVVGGWRTIPVWWTDHWLYLSQPICLAVPASGNILDCGLWQDWDPEIVETDIRPEATFAIPEPYDLEVKEIAVERRDHLESWEVLCGGDDLNPSLFPPANIAGTRVMNRSLFLKEYLIELTWSENPLNRETMLRGYRIYREFSGRLIFIGEVEADQLGFRHRMVDKDHEYRYAVVSVDSAGRTSFPSTFRIK